MKKIDEIGDVARKEGYGRRKSLCLSTEENIELVEEVILIKEDQPGTHSTPAEIARELNIDRRLVPYIIDQDPDLCPLGKCKVQKSARSVQVSYHQSLLRKHYKLHSLGTSRYSR